MQDIYSICKHSNVGVETKRNTQLNLNPPVIPPHAFLWGGIWMSKAAREQEYVCVMRRARSMAWTNPKKKLFPQASGVLHLDLDVNMAESTTSSEIQS